MKITNCCDAHTESINRNLYPYLFSIYIILSSLKDFMLKVYNNLRPEFLLRAPTFLWRLVFYFFLCQYFPYLYFTIVCTGLKEIRK